MAQPDYDCHTPENEFGYQAEINSPKQGKMNADNCVNIYLEVDKDIYDNKGSGTTSYVTAVFNQSATLYANDGVTMQISEIFIWNTPSPYTGTDSYQVLTQFQNYRTSFNGDLGQLLNLKSSYGGRAAGFEGLCNPSIAERLCYSGIRTTYSNVPTYSWTVMVFTHELGHLLGSRHTHACVWNGNQTAIDGCAGGTEGPCAVPGYPANGGTIMSYCHIRSVGINFNFGFGPQPAALINNNVANASCLSSCDGSDCGGGGGTTATGCGVTVGINGLDVSFVSTTNSGIQIIKVRTASWSFQADLCNDWTSNPCTAGASITVPNTGTYVIDIQGAVNCTFTINVDGSGGGNSDNDNDGVCSDVDCDDNDPNIGAQQAPGTACDDGNPNTTNDEIQADGCTCQGTVVGGGTTVTGCGVTLSLSGSTVSFVSTTDPGLNIIKIRKSNWSEVHELCNNWTSNTCTSNSSINVNSTGTYVADIQGSTNCTFSFQIANKNRLIMDNSLAQLQLSPNPTQDKVWVDLGEFAGTDFTIHVFDVLGQRVKVENLSTQGAKAELTIASLENGLYFLVVENATQKSAPLKLIKF